MGKAKRIAVAILRNLGIRAALLQIAIFVAVLPVAAKPQKLPTKKLSACGVSLNVEIADDFEERQIGLMYRTNVPTGTGMLFSFAAEEPLSFWMKNVPFDIDIGYFNSKGELVSHLLMKGSSPLIREDSLPRYPSEKPARFALEVEPGFFAKQITKNCKLSPLPKPGRP